MHKVRGLVYKLGFRPKFGSIFFSPSRHIICSFTDHVKKGKK